MRVIERRLPLLFANGGLPFLSSVLFSVKERGEIGREVRVERSE